MLDDTGRSLVKLYIAARSAGQVGGETKSVPALTADVVRGHQPLTVILLPALFVGDWLWDPLWARLRDAAWPVIRFRESASQMDRLTARSIERLARAVANAYRPHKTGPLVVCGDSLGALVALELGEIFPDDVVGIAVSGAPGLDHAASRLGREVLTGCTDPRQIADRFLAKLLHDAHRLSIDEVRYAQLIDGLATPVAAASILDGLQAIRGYDVQSRLQSLQMPKLFVWGRQDQITPVAPWLDAIGSMPDSRLVVLDQCGHAPMFERPDDFFCELSLLLAHCAGKSSAP